MLPAKLLSKLLTLCRSPLFIISVTALVCLSLSAGLLQKQHHQRLQERTDHYGQALASLAARQATDATLNHDLVSLQVTVSDIARNPDVLNATIHDVENQLLVQAGRAPDNRNPGQHSRSYTAPITLQDSVAGYVGVAVDNDALYERQSDTWLIGLLGLAAALLVLSVLNQRQAPAGAAVASGAATDTEPPPSAPATFKPEHSITLQLRCLNSARLQQQLSGTLRQQLFDDLQGHLSGVNALYHGRLASADNDNLLLQFAGDDLDNTVFRAVCAAQLLFTLLRNGSGGVQLEYAGAIYPSSPTTTLSQQLQAARRSQQLQSLLDSLQSQQLLLDSQDCASASLSQRLQLRDELLQQQWYWIEGLQPSYRGLLDKQARQLREYA